MLMYFEYMFSERNGRVRHVDGAEYVNPRGNPYLSRAVEGKGVLYGVSAQESIRWFFPGYLGVSSPAIP
jgi:hypothetical protein